MQRRVYTLSLDSRARQSAGEVVPVTIATDGAVRRGGQLEILDCTPAGVDLSRAPLPLIVGHDATRLGIGVVENLRADGRRVVGEARFGSSPDAQQIRQDVLLGIHRSVSVGYAYLDHGTETPQGLRYRWEPHEVSIVPAPADINAGFYRSIERTLMHTDHEDNDLEDSGSGLSRSQRRAINRHETVEVERRALETQRVADIREIASRHGADRLVERAIADGVSEQQFRSRVLSHLAAEDEASGGHRNFPRQACRTDVDRVRDTLVARLGGQPDGEILSNATTVELARMCLEMGGYGAPGRESRDRTVERALQMRSAGMHTTSDFPLLLADAVGRVIGQRYGELSPALRAVARLTNRPDFRFRHVVRMGAAPSLDKVNEHGEFTYGSVSEKENVWKLATYGRIIAITRQALVNDDLGGFDEVLNSFGESAARREADQLVALLVSSPAVDSASVFSTLNSSQITDLLTIAGLGNAVSKLRAQREFGELVMQEPGALVVPAALEMTARQLVASFTPNQASNVQPWTLDVVVEPRLDATSAAAWYLVSKNQRALEYGYLDGEPGVQITTEQGFDVDGVQVRARLDFGCGWVSPIGWVKSTGAGV